MVLTNCWFVLKAIEHQYTGKTSYKDHSYRMMIIWLHSLPNCKNPFNELYDALIAINRKEVAGKNFFFHFFSLPDQFLDFC